MSLLPRGRGRPVRESGRPARDVAINRLLARRGRGRGDRIGERRSRRERTPLDDGAQAGGAPGHDLVVSNAATAIAE